MRQREEQVAIQNAGRVVAKKREDMLEQEKTTAKKKIQTKEERREREDDKRWRVKEEWQKSVKLAEEQRMKEDKVQFNKSLAKTLAIEGSGSQGVRAKRTARREMTNTEIDNEFRELNATQMEANTKAAVDQMVGEELIRKKDAEKGAKIGRRMMRPEEGRRTVGQLPPIAALLRRTGREDVVTLEKVLENVKLMKEKKGRKALKIPEIVVEEMDLESGEKDFRTGQRNEVVVDIPLGSPGIIEEEIGGPVEEISTTFLQGILSEQMDMGEEYDLSVQAIVHELEGSEREIGLAGSPSRSVKEELIENKMSRDVRKGGDGKMSSESTEETEKIVIEDSAEEESFVIGTVVTDKEDGDEEQAEPVREMSSPPPIDTAPQCLAVESYWGQKYKEDSRPAAARWYLS